MALAGTAATSRVLCLLSSILDRAPCILVTISRISRGGTFNCVARRTGENFAVISSFQRHPLPHRLLRTPALPAISLRIPGLNSTPLAHSFCKCASPPFLNSILSKAFFPRGAPSYLGFGGPHRRGLLLPAVSVHRKLGSSYDFWSDASLGVPRFFTGSSFQQLELLPRPPCSPLCQQSFTRGLKFVHPRHWILQWKIKPGDRVVVISGKYKDYRGTVLQIDKMRNGVAVSGVKEQKLVRHEDGTATRIPGLIHVSNVMLIDQSMNVGTRVALRVDNHGNVVRVSKKSGLVIPWPANEMIKFGDNRKSREVLKSKEERDAELEKEQNEDETAVGPKDTPVEVALERTYDYRQDVATMRAMRQMMTKYNRELR